MASLDQVVALSITITLGMVVAREFRRAAVDQVRQQLFEERDALFLWWADHGQPEHRRAYDLVRRDFNVVIRFAGHMSLGSVAPVLLWRVLARESPAVAALDADASELDEALAGLSDSAARQRLLVARSRLQTHAGAFLIYGSALGLVMFAVAIALLAARALVRPGVDASERRVAVLNRSGRDALRAAKAWRETDQGPLGAVAVS